MFTKLTERYSISLLIFNWDEIHRTKDLRILKCTVQWRFVHSWCLLPPPLSTPESFHSPQRKPGNPQAVMSSPSSPQPLASTDLLESPWIYLLMDISHTRNHTICDFLHQYLLLLSTVSSRFINVVAATSTHPSLCLHVIPSSKRTTVS